MSAPGFTFDTGALIALERGDHRVRSVLKLACADVVHVPMQPTMILVGTNEIEELPQHLAL